MRKRISKLKKALRGEFDPIDEEQVADESEEDDEKVADEGFEVEEVQVNEVSSKKKKYYWLEMAEEVYGAKCGKPASANKNAEFQNKCVAVSQKTLRMKFQATLIRKQNREIERRAARSVSNKLRKVRKSDQFTFDEKRQRS